MESNLQALQEGLVVMIVGMGIVFSFLCLMACVMEVAHHVVEYLNKIFPPEAEADTKKPAAKNLSASDEDAIAIAIAASRA